MRLAYVDHGGEVVGPATAHRRGPFRGSHLAEIAVNAGRCAGEVAPRIPYPSGHPTKKKVVEIVCGRRRWGPCTCALTCEEFGWARGTWRVQSGWSLACKVVVGEQMGEIRCVGMGMREWQLRRVRTDSPYRLCRIGADETDTDRTGC